MLRFGAPTAKGSSSLILYELGNQQHLLGVLGWLNLGKMGEKLRANLTGHPMRQFKVVQLRTGRAANNEWGQTCRKRIAEATRRNKLSLSSRNPFSLHLA